MQQGDFVKAASIVGIILIVLGIVSLAYFVSPVRFLMQATELHKANPLPPILGGLALVAGIAILFAARPRTYKKESSE
jgi:hypothetical protein